MALKAVLLDIDGTLLLSNDAHARAFLRAGAELGFTSTLSVIRRRIGKGGDKLIPEAFGVDAESPAGKELSELKKKIFKERYLPTLHPTRGARDLLSKLVEDRRKLIVATSAAEDEARQLLVQAGVDDLVTEMASADDAESSKPDPDILEAARDKIGESRNDVMMLGDTPYDVEAARRAGIRIVALRCGGWTDRDLWGALAVYNDPADVLSHYEVFT